MSMGPMYFYTGIPDSKVATLPSWPRKGKGSPEKTPKACTPIRRFLWGRDTVGIKYDKGKK